PPLEDVAPVESGAGLAPLGLVEDVAPVPAPWDAAVPEVCELALLDELPHPASATASATPAIAGSSRAHLAARDACGAAACRAGLAVRQTRCGAACLAVDCGGGLDCALGGRAGVLDAAHLGGHAMVE